MKLIAPLVVLCALILSMSSHAQKKRRDTPPAPPDLTEQQQEELERNRECVYQPTYTLEKRRGLFPFRKAHSVVLISFDKNVVMGEGVYDALYHQIPLEQKRLVAEKADEVVVLSQSGIDSLTDILYNWTYRGEFGIDWFSLCFIPRNAILFVNRKGIVTDYFEICFACEKIRATSKKMKSGVNCTGHMEMIKQFFIGQGIKVGTLVWEGQYNELEVEEAENSEEVEE